MPVCPFVHDYGDYVKSRGALRKHLKKRHQCVLENDSGGDWAVSMSSQLRWKIDYKPYPPEEGEENVAVSAAETDAGLTAMETSVDSVPGEHYRLMLLLMTCEACVEAGCW